jgi:hypothetical protein
MCEAEERRKGQEEGERGEEGERKRRGGEGGRGKAEEEREGKKEEEKRERRGEEEEGGERRGEEEGVKKEGRKGSFWRMGKMGGGVTLGEGGDAKKMRVWERLNEICLYHRSPGLSDCGDYENNNNSERSSSPCSRTYPLRKKNKLKNIKTSSMSKSLNLHDRDIIPQIKKIKFFKTRYGNNASPSLYHESNPSVLSQPSDCPSVFSSPIYSFIVIGGEGGRGEDKEKENWNKK